MEDLLQYTGIVERTEKIIFLFFALMPFVIMFIAYILKLDILDMRPGYYYMGC